MEQKRINKIGRADVVWNFCASLLKIASSLLLLPVILKKFPTDIVAVWSIFSSISVLTHLLDFGFNNSFVRTVTYIFSGCTTLKRSGYETLDCDSPVDYSLLKGVIKAMQWFYKRAAAALFLLLVCAGTPYLLSVLENYPAIRNEVLLAWAIFIVNNTLILYTLYFEGLLQGRGYVKEIKQIIVVSHLAYLALAIVLVFAGCGLVALVTSQVSATIILRVLAHRLFYDRDTLARLRASECSDPKAVLSTVFPNAVKIGITSLGSFLISKSAIFIGSMFMPLAMIASYGITMQILSSIYSVAGIYVSTYIPKITASRVRADKGPIMTIVCRGWAVSAVIYIVSAGGLCALGPYLLELLGSKTMLLPGAMIAVAAVISFLEMTHAMAGNVLLTKNYVPFFIPSIVSGLCTVALLLLFMNFTDLGLWGLILAPGIVQLAYQNWKWPLEVYRDLRC